MSQAELERFNRDVQENEQLRGEFIENAANIAELAEYAKTKGYDWDLKDLKDLLEAKKGELSDEELDKAAGGHFIHHFIHIHPSTGQVVWISGTGVVQADIVVAEAVSVAAYVAVAVT